MIRFIKSYTVRRHVQFVVLQDGELREFQVWEWRASDPSVPRRLETTYRYASNDTEGYEQARGAAIAEAMLLAANERPKHADVKDVQASIDAADDAAALRKANA